MLCAICSEAFLDSIVTYDSSLEASDSPFEEIMAFPIISLKLLIINCIELDREPISFLYFRYFCGIVTCNSKFATSCEYLETMSIGFVMLEATK